MEVDGVTFVSNREVPMVTVIMPAFNAGKFISESITSVLAQEGISFELLVLDDCSTDDTAAKVMAFDDPRIRLVRMDVNMGVSAVTNKGMNLACGKYYARLDSDDLMMPGRLARQVAFMESHPQIGCCGGAVEVFGEGFKPYLVTYPQSDSAIRCAMLFGNPFAHSTLMARMDLIRQYSVFYDETLRHAEDFDFIERLSQYTLLANLPSVLAKYRRHVGQVTERQGQAILEKRGVVRSRHVRRVFPRLLPAQMALHDILAETDMPVERAIVQEVEELLLFYVKTGAVDSGIEKHDLDRVVSTKWLNVCHRARLGVSELKTYFGSPIRRLASQRCAGELALIAKCLRVSCCHR